MIKNKRSQLTILIIIGLMIVVSIILIVGFIRNRASGMSGADNPQAYISECVKTSLEKSEKAFLEGNGYLKLENNYVEFSTNKPGEKVPYLCKASQFYSPCINQEPMLVEKIRKQIETQTQKDAEICFSELIKLLERSGKDVTEGKLNTTIKFSSDYITAEMNKKLSVKQGEEQQIYERFSARIQSPLFNLLNTARQIVNYESEICEFNSVDWMMYFNDISINKFITSDQTKVYTLTDRDSDKKLSLAIKSCVLPAGI